MLHSFSLYSKSSDKEFCRLVLPMNYPRANPQMSLQEYVSLVEKSDRSPYMLFLLGKGGSFLGYYNDNDVNVVVKDGEKKESLKQLEFPNCKKFLEVEQSPPKFGQKKVISKTKTKSQPQSKFRQQDSMNSYYNHLGHKIRKFVHSKPYVPIENPQLNIGFVASKR
ncbi:hypothetical protein RFI_05636, partial [Reticulomyxa filosa]